MLTWLDHLCRSCAELGGYIPDDYGDPRRAFARQVGSTFVTWQEGIRKPANLLEEALGTLLLAFISEFLPAKGRITVAADGTKPPRPLGLVLTRATANLLSAADTANIPDELWRAELGPNRAVYVDIPHSALVLNAGVDQTDVRRVRFVAAIITAQAKPQRSHAWVANLLRVGRKGQRLDQGLAPVSEVGLCRAG